MDVFSKEKRSRIMAKVKGKDTKPERVVRSLLHSMGYRFRLHRRDLPGNPDIVLPKHKKVLFVHGCFWHGHKGCPRSKRPTTNVDFWNAKLDKTIERDKRKLEELISLGWDTLVIWQCEIKNELKMQDILKNFLR
ncbi:MAG: DNA mismatch endonuclease Vsr [Desulfobacteraceae bacterium]|nr:MAG: DNA mismatch endonuclease Vsr [Desulfobacteraceae bacterium]